MPESQQRQADLSKFEASLVYRVPGQPKLYRNPGMERRERKDKAWWCTP